MPLFSKQFVCKEKEIASNPTLLFLFSVYSVSSEHTPNFTRSMHKGLPNLKHGKPNREMPLEA
jgi:hypothetical protein